MAFKTEAIVLHARTLRGADRMYEVLTPHEGRLSVVARSAGRSTSKMAGHMAPFAHVRLMIGRGREDHLAGAVTIASRRALRESWFDFILASSLVELVLRFNVHGQAAVDEFGLLRGTLEILEQERLEQREKVFLGRIFLWKMLSLSGWKPNLDHCALCRAPLDADAYYQSPRGFVCGEHDVSGAIRISPELRSFLGTVLLNEDWRETVREAGENGLAREWFDVSQRYYQDVIGDQLKTSTLFSYA